ncbi:MAG TPA: type VI secretion system tip protein TssI/VgrG [Methylomirabilota bacterium]|nr:type VI secretion system tip protein TssI/VgrG [Methylomirabilota bacterium]
MSVTISTRDTMPTQAKKFIEVKTPLGGDELLIKSFAGTEQISRLFQFDLDLSSEDAEISFEDIIGQKAVVRLDLGDGSQRWFHGVVNRFVQTHAEGRHSSYRATLVPWLWLLTRASDCRIFQNLTVPQIVQKVFEGHGFGGDDFELRLSGSYQEWEYCVQYRETDFNFVSRLMEQEGIFYFFEHNEGQHKLIMADSPSANSPFGSYETIRYHPPGKESEEREETITDWLIEKEVQTGVYALKDFNFKKPALPLSGNSPITREHEKADFEVFDYPGEYEESGEADSYAKLRIQELQAQYEVLRGQASARGVATGAKFTLSEHPRGDQNRPYLVTSTSIHVSTGDFESGQTEEGEYFSCSFTAIPFDQPFRAPRLTPKPMIQGPQTAIVVGPSGEEIHTDEFGRIKLQFHWDRHGKADENSSCWVRVTQFGWAGEKWGGIHIPRMGHEVIVEFLEGDPDRPIVTGRVYNAKTVVPYDLPANKTQSGIKSRSTKEGTDANFNEIRFEDKKGSEEVYIHAEKDKKVIVENDRNEDVGHDETIKIGNDRSESVGNDEEISIGNNRTEDVTKNESITIGENRTTDVGKNDELSVGDNHKVSVGKDETLEVTENRTRTVGKNEKVTVSGDRQEEISKNSKTSVGKALAVEAGDEISLKTGSASITMKKDGTITIKGKDITVEGSGKINIKASSDVTIKGSKIAQN